MCDVPVSSLHKMTTSNKLYIQFVSDESLSDHGFYATFEELEGDVFCFTMSTFGRTTWLSPSDMPDATRANRRSVLYVSSSGPRDTYV